MKTAEQANGLVLLGGASKLGTLNALLAFLDRTTGSGDHLVDLHNIVIRSFGGHGFVAITFHAEQYVTDEILRELPDFAAADGRSLYSWAGPAVFPSGDQHRKSLSFQLRTEDVGREAVIVSQALFSADITIEHHDGILIPQLGKYFDRPSHYHQVFRCTFDSKRFDNPPSIEHWLSRHNVDTKRFPHQSEAPYLGFSLKPEVLGVETEKFHEEGWYLTLQMDGPDQSGMMAAATDFLCRIQLGDVTTVSANGYEHQFPRPGIVRSCSRSVAGRGIVQLSLALPAKDEPTATKKAAAYEALMTADPRMKAELDRGVDVRLNKSPKSPWHYRTSMQAMCFRIQAENRRGLVAEFMTEVTLIPMAEFLDFVEVDSRRRQVDGEFKYQVLFGMLFSHGVDEVATKREVAEAARRAGVQLHWLHPNAVDFDSSWS